ncbi:MAG: sulfatase [Armatimonadetes bacterium]|nr:sulfatase [Armatimonadota bacterium]
MLAAFEPMNLLVIVSDTLRRDYLGAYGAQQMHTPALDRLAEESVVFDRAHCASFPTLPCRAELFTGKFVFPYLNWGPLPRREVVLAEVLAEAGYTCTMVTDNLPLCRRRYDYERGFHSRIRIRGQWYDNFQPADHEFRWPCAPEKLRDASDGRIKQYLRNIAIRRGEEDCFAPQVIREAIHWLEQNHWRGKFFLYVDLFDPHEPWDPPSRYVELYDPAPSAEDVIYPAYGPADCYTEAEVKRIRALYAGEVTLVDRWLGQLLEALDALGRREDTVVAFLSDHGIFLGERGLMGKMGGKKESLKGWPTYCEVSRIPFMLRAPGLAPGRRRAFAHPGDLAPTLLELAGLPVPQTMRAASLVPVLRGQAQQVRDTAVSSWSLRGWSVHRPSVVRTDEWCLVFWRSGVEPELYHLPSDPQETVNVYRKHRAAARDVHRRYIQFLQASGTSWGNYLPRRWLFSLGQSSRRSLFLEEGA